MSVQTLIQKFFPFDELRATICRFPLPVLCSTVLFIIGILSVHRVIDDHEELLARLYSTLSCAYIWSGIATLYGERMNWGFVKKLLLSLAGVGGIAAILMTQHLWWIHLGFIAPALLLILMVAPYMGRGDDLSFWFFNRKMWLGVVVSYAALLLFAGGLSVALWTVHELFDVKINEKVFIDIWLFAGLILGPVYALSWVPAGFDFTEEDCNDPPGLKFIANWISVPMVFVYLLILYAYFIKLLMEQSLPVGQLAYMISGFVGAGVFTYLIAWPLREKGTFQLRLFYRIFFPALIIPAAVHFYAIGERISAYGITEQRYVLVLTAIWFALIAVGRGFLKMPIRYIPLSLGVLFALGAFGFWGGVGVSGASQYSRLEELLIKNNFLVNGTIVKSEQSVSFNDRKSIASILDYLCQTDRDEVIAPWFAAYKEKPEDKWSCYGGYELTEKMGFEYISYYERDIASEQTHIYLNADSKAFLDIKGHDVLVRNVYVYTRNDCKENPENCMQKFKDNDGDLEVTAFLKEDGILSLGFGSSGLVDIEISPHLVRWRKEKSEGKNLDMMVEAENDRIAVRLNFSYINAKVDGDSLVPENAGFELLFRWKN